MRLIRPALLAFLLVSFSAPAHEADDLDTEAASDIFYTDEAVPAPERLLPVGYMLVSKTTDEGLVLACTQTGTRGCEHYRFAYFPKATDLTNWSWQSLAFKFSSQDESLTEHARKKKIQKWTRAISRKYRSRLQRQRIGIITVFTGLTIWATALVGKPVDTVSSNLFQVAGVGGLLVVGYNSAEVLDWITFVSKGTSRVVSGVKIDQMNSKSENFQLKKARVRGAVFERIRSALGPRSYPKGFEQVE